MKKFFSFLTVAAIAGAFCVTTLDVSARSEPLDRTTCYATYNKGETNFVKCITCTEATGSSLTDSGTCKP